MRPIAAAMRLARRLSLFVAALATLLALAPAAQAAENCPAESSHPDFIWFQLEQRNGITLCEGVNEAGAQAYVQIVDLAAGAKMRVISQPFTPHWSDPFIPEDAPYFQPGWLPGWTDFLRGQETVPSGQQLYSLVTGAFHHKASYPYVTLDYPAKSSNAVHTTGENNDQITKRVLGLGDPSAPGQQTLAPLTDVKFGKDAPQVAPQILAPYFDAMVGRHPTEGDTDGKVQRVTIGTRNSLGYWSQAQDKAYIMVSKGVMDATEARNALVHDFGAMTTMRLATGRDAALYKTDVPWEENGVLAFCHRGPFDTDCPNTPQVLAIYAAP